MSTIRVELVAEFKGEDVILLAMDGDRLDAVQSALVQAAKQKGHPARLNCANKTLTIVVEDTETRFDLNVDGFLWRLSKAKLNEIVEKLEAMKESTGPCHHYVDITAPVQTLVLAKDEYV